MMNLNSVVEFARKNTPVVKIHYKEGWFRHDVVDLLSGNKNIGIELGVAKGIYAKRMIESNKFHRFYGVDIYGDTHDTNEYRDALKYIGFEDSGYSLLRMDFESALDLFDDSYFDFVYIDGFAHTGEEGGKTLLQWFDKVKIGGVLAGDDYHDDWPLVKWAVNDFVEQIDAKLYVTTGKEDADYSKYPTWFIVKSEIKNKPQLNEDLFTVAMKEKNRIHKFRVGKTRKIIKAVSRILKVFGLKEFAQKLLDYLRKLR